MALYRNVLPINKDLHSSHKIQPIEDFGFAGDLQTVPLVMAEFYEAHKEYPIVFAKSDPATTEPMPVALVGLKTGQNLYVSANGKWNARYVPAFIRRYPFIFAESGDNRLTLLVDKEYPGFGTATGQPLFDANGESGFLKHQLDFMTAFHQNALATRSFVSRLDALGLLESKSAKVELGDGRQYLIQDFFVVSEERLRNIDMHEILRLFVDSELPMIYAHLMSLSNLNKLVELAVERVEDTIH